MADQSGFTILELIVVIAIMGFLMAMIAPRFAGIVTGAVDPICDTNQQRLVSVVGSYTETNNQLPDGLINIVSTGNEIPRAWDNNKDHVAALAQEFLDRNQFKKHVLDADEAAELISMGVNTIYDLDVDETNANVVGAPQFAKVAPAAGVTVAMIGAGIPAAAGTVFDIANIAADKVYGEPDQMYRIVLGVGPDSSLLKEGLISAAGLCPGGLQHPDNILYNYYNLVLPRLQATVDRVEADALAIETVTMQPIDKAGINAGSLKTANLDEAQEIWQVTTICPEGHKWPGNEAENFKVVTPTP